MPTAKKEMLTLSNSTNSLIIYLDFCYDLKKNSTGKTGERKKQAVFPEERDSGGEAGERREGNTKERRGEVRGGRRQKRET